MKTTKLTAIFRAMLVTAFITCDLTATSEKTLSAFGHKLEAQYAGQIESLRAVIAKALPAVDTGKNSAYQKAREVEQAAEADRNAKQAALDESRGHIGLLNHRKAWIGRAIKGVAEAKEQLKQAKAMTGDQATKDKTLKEAREALAKIEENHAMAASELKKAQALVDQAKLDEPRLVKELEMAEAALTAAKTTSMKASDALSLGNTLTSDTLDAQLAKFQLLIEATPRGLAEYAQEGKAQEALIDKLLADDKLMIQMAVAGGAKSGHYGHAMEIYSAIQKASTKAGDGVLQRLALATALEHAVPVKQRNAAARTDAPETVDPVQRYLHFEKVYLDEELDPGFKGLSAWDYRMVVNGEEPDEILTWGRKMLRNYRPDHITTDDYRWRYVALVRSDIKYGSQCNKFDEEKLQFFQNILKNGGVCGRRAFIGRFILRAFGIPTTARPQRGHAALTHWTPDGWVVCLGGGWGIGWANGPEDIDRGRKADVIFLAQTQARMAGAPYKQVWRAKMVAAALAPGEMSELWDSLALYRRRTVIAEAEAKTLAAVGEDIGEANETKEEVEINEANLTEADRMVTVATNGKITIPAAATNRPTESTGKIIFMDSNLGGKQLHYSRIGDPENFEYTFEAPAAGAYLLTARVVTPSWNQHLTLKVNDSGTPIDIALPFTVGMWGETEPVEVTLKKGQNVLSFSRDHELLKGLTIRDFTLTPVK